MCKVSIIIPVYNMEDYLAECIDSAVNQTLSDIEIICVNNGSTDKSLDILQHYAQMDKRIKIISKDEKLGLSVARNIGVEAAKGKYIAFLDSDDFISNIACELLYNNAEKNNSDIVIMGIMYNDVASGKKMPYVFQKLADNYVDNPFNAESVPVNVYREIQVSAWSKLYRADFVKPLKFYPNVIFEDVEYWAQVFVKANRITYVPVPLYCYRINREGSIISRKNENYMDIVIVEERVEQIFKEAGLWDKYSHQISLTMMMDYIKTMISIHSDFKQELFNKIRALNKVIDYDYYLNGEYLLWEKAYVKHFQLLNTTDFNTFISQPFEVENAS